MKEDLWRAQKERPSVPGRSEKRQKGAAGVGAGLGFQEGRVQCKSRFVLMMYGSMYVLFTQLPLIVTHAHTQA